MRILLCLLVLVINLSAQDPPKPKPDTGPPPAEVEEATRLNNEAVALLAKNKIAEAVKLLRKAVDMQKVKKGKADQVLTTNLVKSLLLWASESVEKKDYITAERRIREAKLIDDKNSRARAYEGVLAYHRGYFSTAMNFLNDALRVNPKEALAYEFIGMIKYKREELQQALASWKLAIKYEPRREKHLKPQIAKVANEFRHEKGMRKERSTHFVCKFGDEQSRDIAGHVLNMLEEAYTIVGSRLRKYPTESLTAVLYADQDFQRATGVHAWAAGIFDGKIRVPVKNFRQARAEVRQTLIHEYCHFVVAKICRRPPAWLNEGLAQLIEGQDPQSVVNLLRDAKSKAALKSFKNLQLSFTTISNTALVRLAYAQSLSFVSDLEQRFGMSRLKNLLRRLGRRESLDRALQATYGRKLSELEQDWLTRL